jgi:multisubunit Na+/H+ antiporter MnhF subunit
VRHAAPEISLISFELSMLPQLVRVMNGAACIDRDAGPNAMATAATIGISLNLVLRGVLFQPIVYHGFVHFVGDYTH